MIQAKYLDSPYILTSFCQHMRQTIFHFDYTFFHMCQFQHSPYLRITITTKWIDIESHRASKDNCILESEKKTLVLLYIYIILEKSYLRNNGDFWSQIMQTNLTNVNIVNNDFTIRRFNDAKECQAQTTFSTTCSTNNSNLNLI